MIIKKPLSYISDGLHLGNGRQSADKESENDLILKE